MKKIVLFISIIFVITGCASKKSDETKEVNVSSPYQEIIDKGNYIIVDVRTNEEYEEGHIKDAINIPYDNEKKLSKLDKTKTILVYCKSGGRSSSAYDTLKKLGYDVYNMGAYASIDLEKE